MSSETLYLEVLAFDWSGTLSDDRHAVHESNMRILRDQGLQTMGFDEWFHHPTTVGTMSAIGFLRACGVILSDQEIYRRFKIYFREACIDTLHNPILMFSMFLGIFMIMIKSSPW